MVSGPSLTPAGFKTRCRRTRGIPGIKLLVTHWAWSGNWAAPFSGVGQFCCSQLSNLANNLDSDFIQPGTGTSTLVRRR